jgi:hypothetical protein
MTWIHGLAVALLAGITTLGAPTPAEAATGTRQGATTRPAATVPAKLAVTPAKPTRAASSRGAQPRHAARPARRSQAGDTAAYDDRAGVGAWGGAGAARASTHEPAPAAASPRAACLAAARLAEHRHGLPEGLMVAVALSESGLHAHALNIRGRAHFPEDRATARALVAAAGGRGYAGCVQISLGHARGSDWPLDPTQATDWAGALMARAYAETGTWTAAVARFHGGSPRGSQRVICRVRAKLEVTAPGSTVLQDASCGGNIARERRNGAMLLEIAEAQ